MIKDKLVKEMKKDWLGVNLIENGWIPVIGNMKRTHGYVEWNKFRNIKKIVISKNITTLDEENQMDTILHEIAHAVEFELYGNTSHGNRWKSIAKQVGARPERLAQERMDVPFKYVLQCTGCGNSFGRHRASESVRYPAQYLCGKCHSPLKRIK